MKAFHFFERRPSSDSRARWLTLLVAVAMVVVLSLPLAYVLYAAPLGERVRLDQGTMQPSEPHAAASQDGESVAITWSDGRISTAAGQGYVYLSYGSEADGGWSRNVFMPDIAVDKTGVPHVVSVEEDAAGTESSIKYASGSNWGSVATISPSSGYAATQPAPNDVQRDLNLVLP